MWKMALLRIVREMVDGVLFEDSTYVVKENKRRARDIIHLY